jgi:hypothetical protein
MLNIASGEGQGRSRPGSKPRFHRRFYRRIISVRAPPRPTLTAGASRNRTRAASWVAMRSTTLRRPTLGFEQSAPASPPFVWMAVSVADRDLFFQELPVLSAGRLRPAILFCYTGGVP